MVTEDSENKKSRGCIFIGVLGLTFLETLMMAFYMGSSVFVSITEPPLKLVPLIGNILIIAFCVYSLYAYIGTFKMKKKAAIGLLLTQVVFLLFLIYVAFSLKPETVEQKVGVGWCVLFILLYLVCIVFVGINLKKMD